MRRRKERGSLEEEIIHSRKNKAFQLNKKETPYLNLVLILGHDCVL